MPSSFLSMGYASRRRPHSSWSTQLPPDRSMSSRRRARISSWRSSASSGSSISMISYAFTVPDPPSLGLAAPPTRVARERATQGGTGSRPSIATPRRLPAARVSWESDGNATSLHASRGSRGRRDRRDRSRAPPFAVRPRSGRQAEPRPPCRGAASEACRGARCRRGGGCVRARLVRAGANARRRSGPHPARRRIRGDAPPRPRGGARRGGGDAARRRRRGRERGLVEAGEADGRLPQAAGDPPLIPPGAEPAPLPRVRHEARLDEYVGDVRPVEAREVGAGDAPEAPRMREGDDAALDELRGANARAVDVVGPPTLPGRIERRDTVRPRVRRSVGVDPDHERRVAAVAEARAGDVPALRKGEVQRRSRHRDSEAAVPERPSRPLRDREYDRGLAGGPPAVLDLPDGRAGSDPLGREVRPAGVTRVQADERRRRRRRGEHLCNRRVVSRLTAARRSSYARRVR